MLQDGTAHCGAGMYGTDDEARKVYAAMLAAAPPDPTESMTAQEAHEAQQWKGMDGACAFHLIERHANGWGDVGKMMTAWLDANR
jgi:hypothetical protein